MRIAVLGAGTAGHMAVAHVSHYFSNASITHFYDPNNAPIGVGEGTTPAFTAWAQRVLGWDFDYLEANCDATRKVGVVFEGWGRDGGEFTHFFGSAEGQACHLSATKLATQLASTSTATIAAERVDSITVRDATAHVATESGEHAFDFVFDARGFPHTIGDQHVRLTCVPTDAAILVRGEPRPPRDRTRAVARSHGWVFVIPLRTETAYGYIHSRLEADEARADFEHFLGEETVRVRAQRRSVPFPNFRRATMCDGVTFSIGNQAAFIEPLEAASLGLTVLQLQVATFWMLDRALGSENRSVSAINHALASTIDEVASFVAWHYARGSRYETPFWSRAAEQFDAWMSGRTEEHQSRFYSYVSRGRALPRELAFASSVDGVDQLLEPDLAQLDTFGGFPDASFAKISHGIGFGSEI